MSVQTSDFDFELPGELIAQEPARERDGSRLLVVDRTTGRIEHGRFRELRQHLRAGDVLVLNNSKVIPARVRGVNLKSGGEFEILMVEENKINDWWVMLRPGKRARVGTRIGLREPDGACGAMAATVAEINAEGHRRLVFSGVANIAEELERIGETPLPPYINRSDAKLQEEDRRRYQTVFAEPAGSVAAPTAGLHFTESLLAELGAQRVEVCFITLHVGLGTFAPVKSEVLSGHVLHEERYELNEQTVDRINRAKAEGRRVVAVGTTTVRVLETAALPDARPGGPALSPGSGRTRIFIYPPYRFRIVDALLTNFHLPRSTLLMLVSAFAAPGEARGRELILTAYDEAIRMRYRFFSYGDAMLVV